MVRRCLLVEVLEQDEQPVEQEDLRGEKKAR